VNKLLDPTDPEITVKRVIRIGQLPENSQVVRPLKIVLSSVTEAKLLLSRGNRLKDTVWSIRPDLSPEDRERQRAAVQELKQRIAKGETNLTIRNFQVVRRRLYKQPVTMRVEIPSELVSS
jgi:hypothetical protein